jgi:hypothetical protein
LKLEILAKYDSFGKLWFSTERWFSQDCRSGFELRANKLFKKKKKKEHVCIQSLHPWKMGASFGQNMQALFTGSEVTEETPFV